MEANKKEEIEASKLRIGDWIQDIECEPYFFQVEQLRLYVGYEIWAYYRNASIKAKEVSPIQITEQWFDKLSDDDFDFCGFGTRVIYQSKKHTAIKYELCPTVITVYFNDELIGFKDFVHEWQNIHFALTNEELKFVS